MAAILGSIRELYGNYMDKADPRVADYFLMSSPIPNFIICVLYLYIASIGGRNYMEKRKPFNVRTFMAIYNFTMVALSAYICIEFALSGWFVGYSLGCQPVDYSWTPRAIRMARVSWLFFLSKYIEMFDTLFFVLRKRFSQVSFLHVFHHGVLPFWWWWGIKFVPGGFGTFHAMINAFVHFIMYAYYGFSALGPKYQKYLWWKKYLTSLQITQFIIVVIHSSQLLFIQCDYPGIFVGLIAFYQFMFLCLFLDFYIKTYNKKSPTKAIDISYQNGKVVSNGSVGYQNGTVKSKGS